MPTPPQSLGTQASATSFYPNLGNADSAFPTAPVTAAPVVNNIVTTAGPATKEFNTHSTNLDNMLATLNQTPAKSTNTATISNTNDAYTQMLDRIGNTSDLATKALIGTIQAGRANSANRLNTEYNNYKSGLQLLGIQHNDAQATPDLLMGHIQQAENEHQAKIQQLDVETNKALMDAKVAKDNGNLAILKEKMAYVKDLNQQKQDYLKNIADQMGAETKIADNIVGGVYAELNKLAPADKERYLQAVAQKYNISLGSLVKAMTSESERLVDRNTKNTKNTTSNAPLSILDIQRYNDLYPDAGINAGDTEAEANTKVAATNTPEAKTRSIIQTIKDGGGTYEEVLKEIGDDVNQIAIAKEVYGITNEEITTPEKKVGTETSFTLPNSPFGINGADTYKKIISGISNFF